MYHAEFNNAIRIFLQYLVLCEKYSVLPLFIYKIDILVFRQEVKLGARRSFKTELTNLQNKLPGKAGW